AASLGLSRGEFSQMRQAYDYSLPAGEYFERCRLKTSGLFTAACRLGAILSGAGETAVAAVGEYGDCLGLAFQIADDILDYSGDSSRSGKLTGTDLRDGTVTLPLIIAMERDPSLAKLLEESEVTGELVEEVRERVTATGALEESSLTAYGYVERARSALRAADEIDTEPLKLIAAAAVDRKA
ncbi:MAG: octaprenyl diphosphate synthase, partial [Gaiellales bacterium]